jgi:hypothetical protein
MALGSFHSGWQRTLKGLSGQFGQERHTTTPPVGLDMVCVFLLEPPKPGRKAREKEDVKVCRGVPCNPCGSFELAILSVCMYCTLYVY